MGHRTLFTGLGAKALTQTSQENLMPKDMHFLPQITRRPFARLMRRRAPKPALTSVEAQAGATGSKVVSGGQPSPQDYFTLSTAHAMRAIALVFLLAGHCYLFCISGAGLMGQGGEWAVMTFLIVSGMGLTKSCDFNRCGRPFIKRRLSRILIPLWFILPAFYLLDLALLNKTYPWYEIALSFAGIIKKSSPNASLWFITFILYLYGLFFLISNIPASTAAKCVLLVLTSFGTRLLIIHVPILSDYFGGWTTYTFAFPLSVCLMASRGSFIDRLQTLSVRFGWVLFFLWAGMAASFIAMPAGRTLFFVAFIAISIFYLDKIRSMPRFIHLLGEHSYEIYLVHFPLLVSYGLVIGREPVALFFSLYCLFVLLSAVTLRIGSELIAKRMGIEASRCLQAPLASRCAADVIL